MFHIVICVTLKELKILQIALLMRFNIIVVYFYSSECARPYSISDDKANTAVVDADRLWGMLIGITSV